MSIETHITHVSNKRLQIKARIANEMAHANPNFNLIKTLKKQNLHLKEEMQRSLRLLDTVAAAS